MILTVIAILCACLIAAVVYAAHIVVSAIDCVARSIDAYSGELKLQRELTEKAAQRAADRFNYIRPS